MSQPVAGQESSDARASRASFKCLHRFPIFPTKVSITAIIWKAVFKLAFLFWGRKWMVIWVSLFDRDIGGVINDPNSVSVIASSEAQLRACSPHPTCWLPSAAFRGAVVRAVLSGESLTCHFKPTVLLIQSGLV